MTIPRTIETIVDQHSHLVDLDSHVPRAHREWHPLVALSREPGAGGTELARRLSARLGYELYDRKLIHEIAESAQLTDRMVAELDEHQTSVLGEWLTAAMAQRHLTPYGYQYHLLRILGSLRSRGSAVVVGRGAHCVLQPGEALRVLATAPRAERVKVIATRHGLSERDAKARLDAEEADRRGFLQQHFHVDPSSLDCFDVVVNTFALGIDGSVAVIEGALPHVARARSEG